MIYELTNWLQVQTGLTFKTQLFPLDWTEDANDVASRIMLDGGPASPNNLNRWVQGIAIETRGTIAQDALSQAYTLYNVMRQKGRVDLPILTTGNQYCVLTFNSPNVPAPVDTDKSGRTIFLSMHRLDMQSELASGNQIEV